MIVSSHVRCSVSSRGFSKRAFLIVDPPKGLLSVFEETMLLHETTFVACVSRCKNSGDVMSSWLSTDTRNASHLARSCG